MKLDKRIEKKKQKDVVTALVCPDCGGTNVDYELGLITGRKYSCPDCGYIGAFILERKAIVDEDDEGITEI